LVVGKAPEPGRTKTRLSPPLSLEQAAELYRAFLLDTLHMATGLGWERVGLVYPRRRGARRELAALVPPGVQLLPQAGTGLGAALAGAFDQHLSQGFARVVLIGSDNPTLPADIVQDACRMLDDRDLVLGPSSDGGYYLIGMSAPHLGVFEHITWSTDVVHAQTLQRARELGLSVGSTPTWYDVDTASELRRLERELRRLPPHVAPMTRSLLASGVC
jgi:rSAM/selenodomain-associated transferase 1